MLAALSYVPSLRPLSILAARIPFLKKPFKSKIRLVSCLPLLSALGLGQHLLTCLFFFFLVGVGDLGPLAVLFGHAGHEEYPALTWHIRSDDWDRLASRSGRGYYKKEGKRETEGGSE